MHCGGRFAQFCNSNNEWWLILGAVDSIERVKRRCLYKSMSYENAMDKTELDTLEQKTLHKCCCFRRDTYKVYQIN